MERKNVLLYVICVVAMVLVFICLIKIPNKNDILQLIENQMDNYDLSSLAGKDGADGKDGINGQDGKNGINGKDGTNGKDGKDGINGKDGLNGINGINGKDGREVEFIVENNVLLWRYVGETVWTQLYEFADDENDEENDEENLDLRAADIVTMVNGSTTDFGCLTDGSICESGTSMVVKVNENESYSFYVIDDDGEGNLSLISSSNIGSNTINTVKWNDANTADTSLGPVSLLKTLSSLTTNWTNISYIKEFNYNNTSYEQSDVGYQGLSILNGVVTIVDESGNFMSIDATKFRARLLTYEEAFRFKCDSHPTDEPDGVIDESDSFTCDTNQDGTVDENDDNPTWLYGNMDGDDYSLRPFGYWLLSSKSSTKVYNVRNNGTIKDNSSIDASGRGIRPVIMIKK